MKFGRIFGIDNGPIANNALDLFSQRAPGIFFATLHFGGFSLPRSSGLLLGESS
jgi:hypothetical protein